MVIDPQIQQILSGLVAVALTAVVTILTGVIVKVTPLIMVWIDSHIALAESKLTSEQLAILKVVVATAVQDAEQRGVTKQIQDTASAKKDYALKTVQERLDALGIPFDIAQADREIEAAINQGLEQSPPTFALVQSEPLAKIEKVDDFPVVNTQPAFLSPPPDVAPVLLSPPTGRTTF